MLANRDFHLAASPFLPQHDGAALIEAHNVERVLADIDTNDGDRRAELLRHSVLLDCRAPGKVRLPVGQEHGRTIPLADAGGLFWSAGGATHWLRRWAARNR